jgi:hypothetical protein
MEPLLPGEQKLGALLEQAGDLIRAADRLAGMCQPGALAGLRGLLRAMNSYYSNRIEGQHTLRHGPQRQHGGLDGAAGVGRADGAGHSPRPVCAATRGRPGAARWYGAVARCAAHARGECGCACCDSGGAYYAHLAAADAHQAGDLDGRGNLSEAALVEWIAYVLAQCADQVAFMTQMLQLDGMKARIAACLAFEENVGQRGVRTEALRGLHYLFATQGELERADFKAMLGLGDRLATAQVSALLARGLLQSDTPYGKLRFGVPQHALRFYFPRLWAEAEQEA